MCVRALASRELNNRHLSERTQRNRASAEQLRQSTREREARRIGELAQKLSVSDALLAHSRDVKTAAKQPVPEQT